jgi:hypothetical protein
MNASSGAAGASEGDIVDVLTAAAHPRSTRLITAAPQFALAFGYDVGPTGRCECGNAASRARVGFILAG